MRELTLLQEVTSSTRLAEQMWECSFLFPYCECVCICVCMNMCVHVCISLACVFMYVYICAYMEGIAGITPLILLPCSWPSFMSPSIYEFLPKEQVLSYLSISLCPKGEVGTPKWISRLKYSNLGVLQPSRTGLGVGVGQPYIISWVSPTSADHWPFLSAVDKCGGRNQGQTALFPTPPIILKFFGPEPRNDEIF